MREGSALPEAKSRFLAHGKAGWCGRFILLEPAHPLIAFRLDRGG
jgi:hypothetical protein